MNDNDFNSLKSDIEVMLEALHGEIDPRRIIVMRSIGQIHITTEVTNFDGVIYDNEPVPLDDPVPPDFQEWLRDHGLIVVRDGRDRPSSP